ncbi:MAG: ABC-2 transporter permease [Clostridiaceae bacterium]|nr:ABC-2 transporter permease [Clostridiaceae bacterium]
MNKTISLVKRDFLLIKKHCFVLLLLEIAVPLLCVYKAQEIFEFGCAVFALTYFFTTYMAIQSIAIAETKYPKVEATLCAAPYSRKQIIFGRYMFMGALFVATIVIYGILSALLPSISMISVMDTIITLLISTVVIGVMLPVQYKLGYEKMKYVYMVIIVTMPVSVPFIAKFLSSHPIDLSGILKLSAFAKSGIALVISALLIAASMFASLKVYNKKEF